MFQLDAFTDFVLESLLDLPPERHSEVQSVGDSFLSLLLTLPRIQATTDQEGMDPLGLLRRFLDVVKRLVDFFLLPVKGVFAPSLPAILSQHMILYI